MPPFIYCVDDNAADVEKWLRAVFPRGSADFAFESNPAKAVDDFTYLTGPLEGRDVDLVLLDINFHRCENREEIGRVFRIDATEEELTGLGIHLLKRLRACDPNVPIGMVTVVERLQMAFQAGAGLAQFYYPKPKTEAQAGSDEIVRAVQQTVHNAKYYYDRDQQRIANRLAGEYIRLETSKPGTVAYWLFEEKLILRIADEMTRAGPISVLDVGCGEGRYLRRMLAQFPDRVHGTGIDFAGRMLLRCKEQSQADLDAGRLVLRRAIAEQLPIPDRSQDLVLFGFGFPCYSSCSSVLSEAARVVRPRGLIFFSIYNFDALFYEAWTEAQLADPHIPISGKIDRDHGRLTIGDGFIKVRPYRMDEFRRLLLRQGFHVVREGTFPTLLSTLPTNVSTTPGGEMVSPEDAYGFRGLNRSMLEQDAFISEKLRDSGYYGVFVVSPDPDVARGMGPALA